MTELKELAEVFFFPPPYHLPHLERASLFLSFAPLPRPPRAFCSAFHQRRWVIWEEDVNLADVINKFRQTKQKSKISYKAKIAWQVYWCRLTIPWKNQSKKRNRFPRASAGKKWGSFLAVFIEFGSLALAANIITELEKTAINIKYSTVLVHCSWTDWHND